jgi:DNA polymerase-1
MTEATVFLIDGHALCYRAFFAVKELRNSSGQPTNAVFGFLNILRKLQKDFSPGYLAVCFDVGRKTRRHERYSEYKIHRQAMPEDLALQLPVIRELLAAFQIPVFESEGFEADDVIATLTRLFSSEGHPVVIVSDDKDMCQLVTDKVRIYNSRRDVLMGPDEVVSRLGIVPRYVPDYLALVGDASDNIPGVDGIGEATAKDLIRSHGGLEEIYSSLETLKPKLKDKLEHGRASAFLSRELAVVDAHVPLSPVLGDLAVKPPDEVILQSLLKKLEFRAFVPKENVQTPLAANGPDAPAVEILTDPVLLAEIAVSSGQLAIMFFFDDIEGHLVARDFMACTAEKIFRFPVAALPDIAEVLSHAQVEKVCYGFKDLYKACRAANISLQGNVFDVLLAGYLLRCGRSSFAVTDLARTYLESADESESGQLKALSVLAQPLSRALHHEGLYDLYISMERPLALVLAGMELEGVTIDAALLANLSADCARSMEEMTGRIYALAGTTFNCNSPKQLGHILFEVLNLPTSRRTKTGFSTDEEVLSGLASQHELPALVLEYRGLAKLKSTYIDALPRMADPRDGRVHCLFDQTGTETGRLSSQRPNLQNIPVRTEFGRRIRGAFIPSAPGNVLLAADYSQIELRVLAHLANEDNMKKAFLAGEDIHNYTAGLIFDVAPDKVTRDMRYNAKRINFGIVYGMSAFGLSRDLGLPQRQAQDFIDRYFLRYPGIRDFMDNVIASARSSGYVETLAHRRRYLPDINSRNQTVRQFAERQAINSPVQGTAADLIKMSMVRLYAELTRSGKKARMIMTVHDELVFDTPQDELQTLSVRVRDVMQTVYPLSVPLEVTLKSGRNWAEMLDL